MFHLGALGLALFPERSLQTLQMLKNNCVCWGEHTRQLLLLDPSPNPAAVLGLRAAHFPIPFLPSPTEAHPRSQLQDGAAWGHQQVKVLSGSFRLRLARQGRESCGCSEERTEGREPWARLAWGAQSTHTERTAQRPPLQGASPQNVPGEALGLQPGAAPRGLAGGERTHSWWALQL